MIRLEEPHDQEAVRNVNETAFGGPTEADLVEALRQECTSVVALVAELNGEVVGHIPFSPVSMEPPSPKQLVGLGLMAVAPKFQRRGIGTLLVREGLCATKRINGMRGNLHPLY
jgi:putative acetyltransferase